MSAKSSHISELKLEMRTGSSASNIDRESDYGGGRQPLGPAIFKEVFFQKSLFHEKVSKILNSFLVLFGENKLIINTYMDTLGLKIFDSFKIKRAFSYAILLLQLLT